MRLRERKRRLPDEPVAMPEPSALFETLFYVGGLLIVGCLWRRKRTINEIQES